MTGRTKARQTASRLALSVALAVPLLATVEAVHPGPTYAAVMEITPIPLSAPLQPFRWLPLGINDRGAIMAADLTSGYNGGLHWSTEAGGVNLAAPDPALGGVPFGQISGVLRAHRSESISADGLVTGRADTATGTKGLVYDPWAHTREVLDDGGAGGAAPRGITRSGTIFGAVGNPSSGYAAALWSGSQHELRVLDAEGGVMDTDDAGHVLVSTGPKTVALDLTTNTSHDLSSLVGPMADGGFTEPQIDSHGHVLLSQTPDGNDPNRHKTVLVDLNTDTVTDLTPPTYLDESAALNSAGILVRNEVTDGQDTAIIVQDLVASTSQRIPISGDLGQWTLNQRGQVAYSTFEGGTRHAWFWDPSRGRFEIGSAGGQGLFIMAMNDKGDVVGFTENELGSPTLWRASVHLPPEAPIDLLGAATAGGNHLTWTPPSIGDAPITEYRIYRNGVLVHTVDGTTASFVDPLAVGAEYTVSAVNVYGESDRSAPTTVNPLGLHLHPTAPTRLIDTRTDSPSGPYATPWGAGTSRPVRIAGLNGVPITARSVALNITVTNTTADSHLTISPSGQPRPMTSAMNWFRGQTTANSATANIGADGQIDIANNAGHADVIIDITGWYDSTPGLDFHPTPPTRQLDSRAATKVGPFDTPWAAGTSRTVQLAGLGAVPSDAAAVAVNVTVTDTTAASHLTVSPAGQARPNTSSLNWFAGQTTANSIVTPVGAGGSIDVFNNAGHADVIIDVLGWFDTAAGLSFHPVQATRALDSRPATQVGPIGIPWQTGSWRWLTVAGHLGVPAGAAVVTFNTTVTGTDANGHLTEFATGQSLPNTSSVNWFAGQTTANAGMAAVGSGGSIDIFNNAGRADVLLDVTGWFGADL